MIRQFRVKYEIHLPAVAGDEHWDGLPERVEIRSDKKKLRSRAAAEKRSLLYSKAPWLAFDKQADDDWCHGRGRAEDCNRYGYPEELGCQNEHTTAREFFERQRAETGVKFGRTWIEERTLSPWSVSEEP